MKLDFNIQINQKQGLALTAQVQQAIKLLHMTNLEIQEFVHDQFQDNPFIETDAFSEQNDNSEKARAENTDLDKSFQENPYAKQETETKVAIENQFETGEGYIPRSTVSKADTDFDTVNLIKSKDKSLYSHCLEFINSINFSPVERIVALRLLDDLEPTGWITEDFFSISAELKCSIEELELVIRKLQEIEPAGLFSRSLKECLTLQAKDSNQFSPNLEVVLENLHLIANGKFDLLKRRSGCSDAEISEAFKVIKSFDPKPGQQFEYSDTPIREPDLSVRETDDGWLVELNNSTLPDVKIEKEYAKDLRAQVTEKKDKEFIQNKISEAKWLTKAIEKRNDTMIKVGSEIVKRQKLFLEKGAQYIKPMVLKDIAEAVGMHESTISRVTTGSLIQTPQGTLELKAFFSVGLLQDNDDGATSATSIKFKIKKLIEAEKPSNPVSDDAIVEILSKEGIVLARRTVAKYRKMENVPSSFARKRRNVIAGAI
jgi:RNA polymerase sigma-54 factor